MSAPRVLFVKLSSLGDVVHHLPALTDLRAHRPDVRIDWAVEEAYVALARLHPALERAIPVALRRLRGHPLETAAWSALGDTRRSLRQEPYDWIVDTQGLLKSAALGRLARGALFGYDRHSAREGLAARLYDQRFAVSRALHAVERNRRLVGAVFGYRPEGSADYGIAAPPGRPAWLPPGDYVVALHASSRRDKRWPDANWTRLAARLADESIAVVYPGGSDAERADAARLAAGAGSGIVAPPLTLPEAATLLAGAAAVVGVDTGLTHLAVALGTPTIGLYVATRPGLTGLHGGDRAVNLGGPGETPSAEAVVRTLLGAAATA